MKKTITILLILLLWLTLNSCWEEASGNEIPVEPEKRDFFIETKKYSDFDNEATLDKTGVLSSTQNITVSSNASWRIRDIYVKVWDVVKTGQTIAVLDDNIANYWLSVESTRNSINAVKNSEDVAKNNLERAKLNYESTKSSLDKQIADIERNLNNLDTTSNTSTSVEIAKIDNSIAQLNITYNNQINSNKTTINGYANSLNKEFSTLRTFIDDIITFSDDILGVTDENSYKSSSFKIYLWAKNSAQKSETENLLKELITFKKNNLENKSVYIDNDEDVRWYITEINNIYTKILTYLNAIDTTLGNSIAWGGTLTDADISSYRNKVSWFKTTHNSYKSAFVSFENWVNSFLDSYKAWEESVLKQIENLEKDKDIYEKSLGLNVESSSATLDEAKRNRDLTLQGLEIAIRDAEISLADIQIRLRDAEIANRQAQIQYDKLSIKSPIDWVVWSISSDKWQEISAGTPMFTIMSEAENEVSISFTKEELDYIYEWSVAYYNDWQKTYVWTIHSISKNADSNLKYVAKVSFPSGTSYIGNILSIEIPVKLQYKLVPVNALSVNNSSTATVNYLTPEMTIEQMNVNVWKVYWSEIEITEDIPVDTNLILNNVDNYDPDKFNLVLKENE